MITYDCFVFAWDNYLNVCAARHRPDVALLFDAGKGKYFIVGWGDVKMIKVKDVDDEIRIVCHFTYPELKVAIWPKQTSLFEEDADGSGA